MPLSGGVSLRTVRVAQSQRKAHKSPLACKATSAAKANRTVAKAKAQRAASLGAGKAKGGYGGPGKKHNTAAAKKSSTAGRPRGAYGHVAQAKKTAAVKAACAPSSAYGKGSKASAAAVAGSATVLGRPSGRP